MVSYGECLLRGIGGPKDITFGAVNVTQAAELGSSLGAYLLGRAFFKGRYGLPKDPAQARFWLKKIVDGECEVKHLHPDYITEAAGWLRELEQE